MALFIWPVAVKVPHARLISQPEDFEALLAEARTVANLDHPNIVPVHDVGSTEDWPCYVVSKYVEGTNLSARIKEDRFEYAEAAELVATVAEALHYAHKQGLVHRDVKPGNILIGNDGKPYLIDFGLALREENLGKGPRCAGTPAYMSPEQARGEGHRVDGRSDIFSLSVMFYELLVGRRPFRGDTPKPSMKQAASAARSVLRRAKVRVIASASLAPSNGWLMDSDQISKKSFIRLFNSPSLIMASDFSAIAVSRLYESLARLALSLRITLVVLWQTVERLSFELIRGTRPQRESANGSRNWR